MRNSLLSVFTNENGARVNLTVCKDEVRGITVYVDNHMKTNTTTWTLTEATVLRDLLTKIIDAKPKKKFFRRRRSK